MIRELDQSNGAELEQTLELIIASQHIQHVDIEGRDTPEQSLINAQLSFKANLADKAAHYFVSVQNDHIDGYVLIRQDVGSTALLDDLGVSMRHQRHGLGSQLVEYAVTWARQHHLISVKLITQHDNLSAAATYRRAGFSETPGDYINFEKKL